jgi:N-acetylmuramoyl-L-alanine amidase
MADLKKRRAAAAVACLIPALLFCLGALHCLRAEPASPVGQNAVASPAGQTPVAAPAGQTAVASPAGETPENAACDRGAFRLVVDVGHTKEVPGAIGARGVYEYEFNLRLAKLAVQKLTEAGFDKTLLLITGGRAHSSLAQRVARANSSSADLFLSIHHDSVPNSFLEKWEFLGRRLGYSDRFKGHSIFVSNANPSFRTSVQFASLLGKELNARGLVYAHHYTEKFMGHRQRILVDAEAGVYRYDQLIVLKDTRMPAVLLEAGSIINRDEEQAMASPERQLLIASSVVRAVENFCAARGAQVAEYTPRHHAKAPPAKATPLRAALHRSARAKSQ